MARSKTRHRVRRVVLLLVLLVLAAAGALYLLASWAPDRYRPADLAWEQRGAAAKAFAKLCLEDFRNHVQVRRPFAVSVSQDQTNRFLASMDEIAGEIPGGRPGEMRERMERAGLAEPAVAIESGVLTLMVRLTKYGKVLSADLSFDFLPDGRLQVRLREVRLGRLAVPEWLYRERVQSLRGRLAPAVKSTVQGLNGHGVSAEDVSAFLAAALGAIDETPISTEIPKYGQRVAGVDLKDGTLTLRFEPVSAATAPPER